MNKKIHTGRHIDIDRDTDRETERQTERDKDNEKKLNGLFATEK